METSAAKKQKIGYAGYCLPPKNPASDDGDNQMEVECLEAKNDDPKAFFTKFVQTRTPVKIRNALRQPESDLYDLWKLRDLSYLEKVAGNATVHVERRQDGQSRFGRSRTESEIKMKFGDFLNAKDRHLYYLSTQPTQLDDDGRPATMYEPVSSFQGDFPLRPKLGGNMIPMSYNLWMGGAAATTTSTSEEESSTTQQGSSSGLHHDFHDNFYCLLAGRKRFVLYSPDQAAAMKTRGTIRTMHPNGLINYENDTGTNENGVDLAALKSWQMKRRVAELEEEFSEAELAVANGEEGVEEMLEKAEAALDEAMEAMLEAQVDFEDEEESQQGSLALGNGDDYDDEEEEEQDFWAAMNQKKAKGEDGSELKVSAFAPAADKKPSKTGAMNDSGRINENDDDEEYPSDLVPCEKLNNFSGFESAEAAATAASGKAMTVSLEAGDVFYLPAGWFHEVTSYSTEHDAMHIAFNYWFHPPSTTGFEMPYESTYWHEKWAEINDES